MYESLHKFPQEFVCPYNQHINRSGTWLILNTSYGEGHIKVDCGIKVTTCFRQHEQVSPTISQKQLLPFFPPLPHSPPCRVPGRVYLIY